MIKLYPMPKEEVKSSLYTVMTEVGAVDVYDARVSAMPYNTPWPGRERPLDQTERAAFVIFDADGPVRLSVTAANTFESAIVRPLSKNASVTADGKTAEFTLPGPGSYTFEADGFHGALHIFVNPIEEFKRDENTIYYGPGVHYVGDVWLESGQTAFIDGGAVVYGAFLASNAKDVSVVGHGVIDGSWETRTSNTLLLPYSYTGIIPEGGYREYFERTDVLSGIARFFDCENVTVRGVTARDSSTFCLIPARCENLLIDNFKTVGMYRYNSDGIDLFNCKNVEVRNCFLRNFDDCMVIKGICGWDNRNNENITVKNTVVWCDWGRALELGAETNAPEYKNILFEDCDIIHPSDVCMDIQHHNRAEISNVTFRNIRCEYNSLQQPLEFQSKIWDSYNPDAPVHQPILMGVFIHRMFLFCPKDRFENGSISGVRFENISVLTDGKVAMPESRFLGLDENHTVRDVTVEGLSLDGETPENPNIAENEFYIS